MTVSTGEGLDAGAEGYSKCMYLSTTSGYIDQVFVAEGVTTIEKYLASSKVQRLLQSSVLPWLCEVRSLASVSGIGGNDVYMRNLAVVYSSSKYCYQQFENSACIVAFLSPSPDHIAAYYPTLCNIDIYNCYGDVCRVCCHQQPLSSH